jgi:hypothetical protein
LAAAPFNGVIQVIGEIREQIEVIIESVRRDLRPGMIVLAMPFRLQAVAILPFAQDL